ncbi:PAS domain S-box protein [Nocardioides sp. HB32]
MEEPHPEALLRGVFEAVPDAVVVVDGNGAIVLANARCGAVFGRDAAALIGEPIEVLVPEPLRSTGLVRLPARRADGTEFSAEISLAPIQVDGTSYVSAIVRDVTARVRDEERFRSLLEAAPDPTVIVDRDATIVLANNQMQDVFGYPRAELVGRPVDILASTPGPAEVRERIGRYLVEPDLVPMGYTQEFRILHHAGHEVPVEIGLSPLHTDEGVLVSIAVRDVSERRRLEVESQQLRDELIATVSHELRTPLTSIIGYSELMGDLDDGDLSRRARKLLGVIERNAERELQLVDDLLTMAYLDDNRLRIDRRAIDLVPLARQVAGDANLRARERGLELTLVAADSVQAYGDFYRLVQVLENLLTNALKFTAPGGRIDVAVRNDGPMGVLEVRDTGVGVSAEEKEKVFDRLYRAPSAIRGQVQGAGLGLPIVRAIVEAHDGTVDVESEVGVGTVVRVSIPRERPADG